MLAFLTVRFCFSYVPITFNASSRSRNSDLSGIFLYSEIHRFLKTFFKNIFLKLSFGIFNTTDFPQTKRENIQCRVATELNTLGMCGFMYKRIDVRNMTLIGFYLKFVYIRIYPWHIYSAI